MSLVFFNSMFNIQMVHNLKGMGQLHVGLFSIFNWLVLFDILAFLREHQFKFQRCYSFCSKAMEAQTVAHMTSVLRPSRVHGPVSLPFVKADG